VSRHLLACAALIGVASFATPSFAQETDVDRARKLAQDAADSLDDGDFAAALDRAKQAEELYHAPTHILLIAQALEGQGHLAEAADTYERLIAEPLPSKGSTVFRKAQDDGASRLKALVAKIPSLLLKVSGPKPGAAIATVDGKPFAGFETARRFDPGEHKLRVEAEGFVADEQTITLPPKGGVVAVEIILRAVGEPAKPEPPPPTPPDTPPPPASPFIAPTIITLSVGIVGLGVGGVTGGLFLSQLSDLKDRCPNDRCAREEQPNIDSTGTMGTVSTVAFAVGGAATATGVVLLGLWLGGVGTDEKKSARSNVDVLPLIGPGWLGVGGRF
jgi:hypothetical protein